MPDASSASTLKDLQNQCLSLQALTWTEVQEILLAEDSPVTARYRALFHARNVAPSPAEASELLLQSLPLQKNSVLLRHEFYYVLGQIGERNATAALRECLHDETEDEIVRHEAAEGLAALGESSLVEELESLATRTSSEVLRHTCELAVAGLRNESSDDPQENKPPVCMCQYTSNDPGKGKVGATEKDVPAAAEALADTTLPLYERYGGMFTLRNVGGSAAVEALTHMLLSDESSVVLRHEVAFVLGQMEDESAVKSLIASLAMSHEHGVVRHESAIALGTVGTEEADEALRMYVNDADQLVAESCEVALQTSAYWRAWEELEARVAADV